MMDDDDDDLVQALAAEAELSLRLRLDRRAEDTTPLQEAMFGLRVVAEHASRWNEPGRLPNRPDVALATIALVVTDTLARIAEAREARLSRHEAMRPCGEAVQRVVHRLRLETKKVTFEGDSEDPS
jgi:hypothetical protein